MIVTIALIALFLGVSAVDISLAIKNARIKTPAAWWMCGACVGSYAVTISYLGSIFTQDYFLHSLLCSIYFVSIDFSVLCLLAFVIRFTSLDSRSPMHWWVFELLLVCGIVDSIVLMINPFYESAIHYTYVPNHAFHNYSFEFSTQYYMHLFYVYVMVVAVLYRLIVRMIRVPSGFREKYMQAFAIMMGMVVLNVVYLYLHGSMLDYSLLGYSIGAIAFSGLQSGTSTGFMSSSLQNWMFNSIDQGLVIFDFQNRLYFHNEMSKQMLSSLEEKDYARFESFVSACGLEQEMKDDGDNQLFQCYVNQHGDLRALRCNYSAMRNNKGTIIGRMFVFQDQMTHADPITGFYTRRYFLANSTQLTGNRLGDIHVVVFDVTHLHDVNISKGRSEGDRIIRELALAMQNAFPSDTSFVRGHEAVLCAVCMGVTDKLMGECIKRVERQMQEQNISVTSAQYYGKSMYDAANAMEKAQRVLNNKKLLQMDSRHSSLIGVLVQALEVTDSDTQAHVQRTQKLGSELGKRIGLTDEQQTKLALLALLHDIGKIGIPLEILNKPGKLTDAEWKMLQTHVTKGYQIANATEELQDIADMILHHHEHWNGSGYPSGLVKEDIPLLSRMIAVVDAYDAMMHDRPYRARIGKARAMAELKRCAGTQFDPFIVTSFLDLLRSMPDEAEEDEQVEQTVVSTRTLGSPGVHHMLNVHRMKFSRYTVDEQERIHDVDDYFFVLTGYSREDVKDMKLTQNDLIFPEDREEYFQVVREEMGTKMTAYLEHRLRTKSGQARYVICMGRAYFDASIRQSRTEITVYDISQSYLVQTMINTEQDAVKNRIKLHRHRYRDEPSFSVLQKERFCMDMERLLSRDDQRAMMLQVQLDSQEMDQNKQYEMMVRSLSSALREEDYFCCVGDNRYTVMLFFEGKVEKSAVLLYAHQIFDKVNMTLNDICQGACTASMGGVMQSAEASTFEEMNRQAEHALQQAMQRGRSAFSVV